jgi:hypothetical protein
MKRKNPTILQGVVTELMTQLANLPEREKAPEEPVSLSEIFRSKEYIAEIKGALKRGYSFDDLAEIFTEKCGVGVSARQMKCHFTREINRGKKGKSVKKAGEDGVTKIRASSADSSQKNAAQNTQRNLAAASFEIDSEAKVLPKGTEKGTGFAIENSAARGAKSETLSTGMKL